LTQSDIPLSGSDHTYSAFLQENIVESGVMNTFSVILDTFSETSEDNVAKVAKESIIKHRESTSKSYSAQNDKKLAIHERKTLYCIPYTSRNISVKYQIQFHYPIKYLFPL
jgi:hypothetical protein